MGDDITIGVTEIVNNIEVTAQPNDQIVDISVIDNTDEVTLNITPTVIEINVNKGSSYAKWGTILGTLSDQEDLQDALDLKANLVDGKVPASELPSYVDDVIEVADYASLPATGEIGKIYVTLDDNKIYRWSGSIYIEIAANNAIWGAITGALSNQLDLQDALNLKANDNEVVHLTGTETISGTKTFSSILKSGLLFINETGGFGNISGFTQLGGTADYFQVINGANTKFTKFIHNGGRSLTMPSSDGTLALTSQLHDALTIGTANGLSLSGQELSLALASTSTTGALSSTHWNTFNNKQPALNGTGFVKASGTTISYDNSTYALDNEVVKLTGDQTIAGTKTFSSDVKSTAFRLTGGTTGTGLYYGHTNKVVLANYTVGGGIDFETNGGAINMVLDASANLSVVGSVTSSSIIKVGGTSTQYLMADGSVSTVNGISGSGTTNYIPKFTGASSIGNSSFFDNGSSDSGVTNASYSTFILKGSGTNDVGGGVLKFGNQTKDFAEITGETESANNGMILFRNLKSGTITESMRIFANGNTFIGASPTDAGYKLDVNGTSRFVGNMTVTGTVTASGGFFQSSDIRLKEIVDYDYSVSDIKPISYLWKDSRDNKKHVGYSAQEVQKVMPDAVNEGEDGILSVNYIEVLVAKIAELENRIKQIEK